MINAYRATSGCDNVPELVDTHDHSPVILDPADWDTWLHAPLDELARFERPLPAARMDVQRIDVLWKYGGRGA